MSLKERLEHDMKEAMKAREAGKTRLSTIRMIRSAVKNAEIDKGRELDDDEVIEVLAREMKQRQESLAGYEQAGRAEAVEQVRAEMAVIEEYLPEPLSREELEGLIRQVIEEVGASSPKEMGKVMGRLMPRVKGRADGKLVNQLVRELLS